MTVIVLYGPKAAGKSQVAGALRKRGVADVDADELALDLLARGAQPHPQLGWLSEVESAVAEALREHDAVSVEATGALDSDWQLAEDFEAQGQQVLKVWVWALLALTLRRLATRGRVPGPDHHGRGEVHVACRVRSGLEPSRSARARHQSA